MGATVQCPTSTCTLVIQPYQATADDYAAVALVFAATLTAASVIWGVKRLYRLLTQRPEA